MKQLGEFPIKKKLKFFFANKLPYVWYESGVLSWLLIPFSYFFALLVFLRKASYIVGIFDTFRASAPVIIVGNISVGGTGKTPLIIWLADFLKSKGLNPGIVCRGYGGWESQCPVLICPETKAREAGDEAVLLFRKSGCPVMAGPDRVRCVKMLLEQCEVDVILSDDGLQHYGLARDIEVILVDGERRYGNGRLLPAGPLRERTERLKKADFVVVKGSMDENEIGMLMEPAQFVNIQNPSNCEPLNCFQEQEVNAVCGIGNNESFFQNLERLGITYNRHPFPDHYRYSAQDFKFWDGLPVIMTEKDAVKCEDFAGKEYWSLSIRAFLPEKFGAQILKKIVRLLDE